MNSKTQKIVTAAMLAALTCIATMIIKIPSPMKGYLNLGDCLVLLCGWILSPMYGFLAAGLGSALADFFSGYLVYAPATFVIKGLMSLTVGYIAKGFKHKASTAKYKQNKSLQWGYIIGGFTSECIMVLGYLLFESILYGFIPSLINVPVNGMQGIAGLILGVILINVLSKTNLFTAK